MKKLVAITALAAASLALSQPSYATTGWSTNMPAALERAAAQGKDVLLTFMGSDWCGACITLNEQVFGQEAFQSGASEHFELVLMDFPRGHQLPPALAQQNQHWADRLNPEGMFPKLMLLDADGKPYAQVPLTRGGPEVYVAQLAQLRQLRVERDAMFAAADGAQGIEKAGHLDAALKVVGMDMAAMHYTDTIERIVALDPDNEAGLNAKYAPIAQLIRIDARMQGVMEEIHAGRSDQAVAMIDAVIQELVPQSQVLAQMRVMQSQIRMMQQRQPEALAYLDQAIAAVPGTPIAAKLEVLKRQLEATAPAQS